MVDMEQLTETQNANTASETVTFSSLESYTDLGEGDASVLKLLASEFDGSFSFQGMRRALRMHQEKLSRILRRLEKSGLVDRTNDGYRLSQRARQLIGSVDMSQKNLHTLIDTLAYDNGLILAGVVSLKGRWIAGLRWLDYASDGTGHRLEWMTEDGRIIIRLRLSGGRLTVETNAESSEDRQTALKGAYAIVRKAYELALNHLDQRVMTMRVGYLSPVPWT